jgi:dTDP-4-dehydrorhamnose 3,5-epimerase
MVDQKKILIIGSNGQLGKALQIKYPNARKADINDLDISSSESINKFNWSNIEIILNVAAYTKVDQAETDEGRRACWKINASSLQNLVRISNQIKATLVHISSDYVFDGQEKEHLETECLSPLSVYGESKAAGDLLVQMASKYYLLRTSWVIGDGNNFVRTMLSLGKKGISPSVVNDQIGRLTFTNEIVRAVDFLISNSKPYGTYNITNCGESMSWFNITKIIFDYAGFKDLNVVGITTEEYFKGKKGIAKRPFNSTLNLNKINNTGFKSTDWKTNLKSYINIETRKEEI